VSRKYKDRRYAELVVSAYPWIPVDHHRGDFQLKYNAIFTSAATATEVSAKLQGTYDDVFTVASCKAFVLAEVSAGGPADGMVTQPIVAVRLNFSVVNYGESDQIANCVLQLLQVGDE